MPAHLEVQFAVFAGTVDAVLKQQVCCLCITHAPQQPCRPGIGIVKCRVRFHTDTAQVHNPVVVPIVPEGIGGFPQAVHRSIHDALYLNFGGNRRSCRGFRGGLFALGETGRGYRQRTENDRKEFGVSHSILIIRQCGAK